MFLHNSQITYNCSSQTNNTGTIELMFCAMDYDFTAAFREITLRFMILLTHDPEKCLMRAVYHPSLAAGNSPFPDPDDSVQTQYGPEMNPSKVA